MKKKLIPMLAILAGILQPFLSTAQEHTVSGKLLQAESHEPVAGASVRIKGSEKGTLSNELGEFRLSSAQALPWILVISHVGFETIEYRVAQESVPLQISMVARFTVDPGITITTNLMPKRIIESPVSIERVTSRELSQAPNPDAYSFLGMLKGVDVNTSSLTFKSMSTRGFSTNGSARVNQYVDGMDNQAPGLNFSVGNIVGLTDMDMHSVELLPGASSVLYGSGGMNGTIVITSKNPFDHPGFSAQVRGGMMNVDQRQRDNISPYFDASFRWARKVSDRFAFKLNAQYLQVRDWLGDDLRNVRRNPQNSPLKPGDRFSDPDYDGLHVYGDETRYDINTLFLQPARQQIGGLAKLIYSQTPDKPVPDDVVAQLIDQYLEDNPSAIDTNAQQFVSRTGYEERHVLDPYTRNLKLSGAVHYRFTSKLEAILAANWGTGNSAYTASDRYGFQKFRMGQYRAELRGGHWFLRGYTTMENAGESFNSTSLMRRFNEAWRPSQEWYPVYAAGFLLSQVLQQNGSDAHALARSIADIGRPEPESQEFDSLKNVISSKAISQGGARFLDRSKLYAAQAQYDFTKHISWLNLVAGANFRRYILDSQGTLFVDYDGPIGLNEFGAYVQAEKKLFREKLILGFAGRYDKHVNFKGRFTPRFSAVYNPTEHHAIRASYQTAYRFPTNQQQYIFLEVGSATFLLPGLAKEITPHIVEGATFHVKDMSPYTPSDVKPEWVKSWEIGYRGLWSKRFYIDAYAYYTEYTNFIGRETLVAAPGTQDQKILSIVNNSGAKVNTLGTGLSVRYLSKGNFVFGMNIFFDEIRNVPNNFTDGYNTPRYRFTAVFGNHGFGPKDRFGFNLNYRYQAAFYYESDFASHEIPAFGVMDAQVSYKIPAIRSVFRVGAANVFNRYYQNGAGNPKIGGLYYASLGYNIF